jgi:hypothetical protein
MRKLLILAAILISSPAWSQEQTGFYLGGDIYSFDTKFENLPITADGTALGVHAGYRHSIGKSSFIEGEISAASLNGETNTGKTDFESYYAATVGVGTYFSSSVYGLAFAGIASLNTQNATIGSQRDDGTMLGLGLGYDITPQHSVSLRYFQISVDGDFGDVDSDNVGFRYSYRF